MKSFEYSLIAYLGLSWHFSVPFTCIFVPWYLVFVPLRTKTNTGYCTEIFSRVAGVTNPTCLVLHDWSSLNVCFFWYMEAVYTPDEGHKDWNVVHEINILAASETVCWSSHWYLHLLPTMTIKICLGLNINGNICVHNKVGLHYIIRGVFRYFTVEILHINFLFMCIYAFLNTFRHQSNSTTASAAHQLAAVTNGCSKYASQLVKNKCTSSFSPFKNWSKIFHVIQCTTTAEDKYYHQ